MTVAFHPKSLFEPFRWPKQLQLYHHMPSTLGAVRDRKKALLRLLVRRSALVEGNTEVAELLEEAFRRGLSVILDDPEVRPRGKRRGVAAAELRLYVLHLEEAWRVPALNALNATAFTADRRWSLSAEAQESLLLGYTAAERERWIVFSANAVLSRRA